MTVRCKGLVKIVSRFPRATTSVVQLKHRLCTLLKPRRRRAGQNRFQDPSFPHHVKMGEVCPKAPRSCRRTCIHCRTKRCAPNCTCQNSTVFSTVCPCQCSSQERRPPYPAPVKSMRPSSEEFPGGVRPTWRVAAWLSISRVFHFRAPLSSGTTFGRQWSLPTRVPQTKSICVLTRDPMPAHYCMEFLQGWSSMWSSNTSVRGSWMQLMLPTQVGIVQLQDCPLSALRGHAPLRRLYSVSASGMLVIHPVRRRLGRFSHLFPVRCHVTSTNNTRNTWLVQQRR